MSRRRRRRRKKRLGTLKWFIFLCIIIIGIPALLVRGCDFAFFSQDEDITVKLWREDLGELVTLTLDDYIAGVVAAEMPASFELEALKAQAVAARTYAYRRIQRNDRAPEHPDAHFSTDHRSGQAWTSWDDLRQRWGLVGYYTYRKKIEQAVESTKGEIALYNNEPILAVYHSTSGGRTENSENYWADSLPYLRSVDDPYGEHSPHHFTTASFSKNQFLSLMNSSQGNNIRVVNRYPSGRVKTFEVGDTWYSGREVRERLNLRSSWFTLDEVNGTITFSVWGYGHGVGMSQYGADGMAKEGYDYREILQYYYRNIEIRRVY